LKGRNGFTTLNASVYWAIVTITTVGYGDITPHTPIGRILASVLILIGYSIIAIPTGLITTHMTSALQHRRARGVQTVSTPRMIKMRVFATPAAVNCGIVETK
jgi:voltage-gated potassium channel Kch